ncbi:MAG TPA: serine hydrolase [Thermoleophilia bacterium]|nr:serine hydrolase [Thermoleophilia bacterium]
MRADAARAESLVTLANWQQAPWNRWSFQRMRQIIPSARVSRGRGPVRELPAAPADLDGLIFETSRGTSTLARLLSRSYADGFLVLHRGRIVTEQYFNGMERDTPHLLQSISKSIVGGIVGVLVGRGVLAEDQPVAECVPELTGTSFEGATVRHLLDMTAGTRFSEDYDDPDSDVRLYERAAGWQPAEPDDELDLLGYILGLPSDREHGERFEYRSILTDVLGLVVERVSGLRFAEAMSELLWAPLGAGFDAEITVDRHGYALTDGGLSVTLRDLARFGQLYLQSGCWDGHQVVPAAWVNDTRYADRTCRETFADSDDARRLGFCDPEQTECYTKAHYRNCWWVLDPQLGVLLASGIYGQTMYVNMFANAVIVLLASRPEPFDAAMNGDVLQACSAISSALTLLS